MGETSQRSRRLVARVKGGDPIWLSKYAWRTHEQATQFDRFPGFFSGDVTAIPVPGRAPLVTGALWVPSLIALQLQNQGLVDVVWPGLRRIRPVTKSATAARGERPSVAEHFESLAIEDALISPRKIVLIDDVVTKGRTLLAAGTRVREAFPQAEIRAFALVRTMGLVPDVTNFLTPCVGSIVWRGEDAEREP